MAAELCTWLSGSYAHKLVIAWGEEQCSPVTSNGSYHATQLSHNSTEQAGLLFVFEGMLWQCICS